MEGLIVVRKMLKKIVCEIVEWEFIKVGLVDKFSVYFF